MSGRPRPMAWRDAIRDSELDPSAKLAALVLSTYMNLAGEAWPSKETLAAGIGLTKRTVDNAILRLEAAGFLEVDRSHGRSSNRYRACRPGGRPAGELEDELSPAKRSTTTTAAAAGRCPSCEMPGGNHTADCQLLTEPAR